MHSIQSIPRLTPEPTIVQINPQDHLSRLPEEAILKVFSYLSAIELAKCGEVSRRCKRLASDATLWNAFNLSKISPRFLKVFDGSDWAARIDSAFKLTLEDTPQLDKRTLIPTLISCPSSLQIEENEGITLLTIPKDLSLNMLTELSSDLRFDVSPELLSEIGNIRVENTYHIVITNHILKKSRELTFVNQQALVKEIGFEIPTVLEAAALLFVASKKFGDILYENCWQTATCGSEQLAKCNLERSGENSVSIKYSQLLCHNSRGVGAVLRF